MPGRFHRREQFPLLALCSLVLLNLPLTSPGQAELYEVGDRVDNLAFIDRATGSEVRLRDFEGSVLLLEWFAYWCPFCKMAAPQVRDGIVNYYKMEGGNPNGAPVKHIAVNMQPNANNQTNQFAEFNSFEIVLDDYTAEDTRHADFLRSFRRFRPNRTQPYFAIINGITDSPSHGPWELLFSRAGYGSFATPVEDMRAIIDQVAIASAPAIRLLSDASMLEQDWFFSDWLGYFNGSLYPWIFHIDHGWLFTTAEMGGSAYWFFDLGLGWWYADATAYPSLYSAERNAWIFFFVDSAPTRQFADLATGEIFTVQ